jgi:trehalose 6-phosphate synthase
MQAALQEHGGLWFGWSGKVAPTTRRSIGSVTATSTTPPSIFRARITTSSTPALPTARLWPMLHYRPDMVDYQRSHLDGYLKVNELFAENLLKLIKRDDTIWVHDYHLIPLASMLRERGVKNRIGFFLHTPLPPAGC